MKYRKKSKTVDAVLWKGVNIQELIKLIGSTTELHITYPVGQAMFNPGTGMLTVEPESYVVLDGAAFSVLDGPAFSALYELDDKGKTK